MPELVIPIPKEFLDSMKPLMENVQKFAKLMEDINQTLDKVKLPNMQIHMNQTQSRMGNLHRIFKNLGSSLAANFQRIVNNMGSFGQVFMKTLQFSESVLSGILKAAGTIITVGAYAVGIGIGAGMGAMKWLWDKMVGLGDSMLQDYLLATGTHSSIGGIRAFRTSFAALPADPAMYSSFVQARGSMASRQFLALRILGIKNVKDTTDMMVSATLAAARFMKQQAKGNELMMAAAVGLTSLFSPQYLQRLLEMDEEELKSRAALYEANKEKLKISDTARVAWVNFSIQVRSLWVQVQNIIAEKLADPKSGGLIKSITRLSDSLVKFFRRIMETQLTEKIVEYARTSLVQFGEWLAGDGPRRVFERVKIAVKGFIRAIRVIIEQLVRLKNVFRPTSVEPEELKKGVTFRPGIRTHPGAIAPSPRLYPRSAPSAQEPAAPRAPGAPPRRGAVPPPTAPPTAPPTRHVRRLGPRPTGEPAGPPRRLGQTPGQQGVLYDPISGTSLGGGVGGTSASMGAGRHQGDDIMAPIGTPVYAVEDGVIDRIGTDNFGKMAVTIRHPDGTYSRYLHMGSLDLKKGDKVTGGQQIGTSGSANGVAHLHFERWRGPPGQPGSELLNPRKEFGWDKSNLPQGGQKSRSSGPQPPPSQPAPEPRPSVPGQPPRPSTSDNPRPGPPAPQPPRVQPSTSANPRPTPQGGRIGLAPVAYTRDRPTPPGWERAARVPAAGGYPTPGNSLAADRASYARELENNPALREKVLRIAANEQGTNPEGTQMVLESMMNRASTRHTTLAAQAHWVSERGYYADGNKGVGIVDNPQKRPILEQSLTNALGGSNSVNYATGNASNQRGNRLADKRISEQGGYLATSGGEYFFHPNNDERGDMESWTKWRESVSQGGGDPRGMAAAIAGGGERGGGGGYLDKDIPWKAPPQAQWPTGTIAGEKSVSAGPKPPMLIFRGVEGRYNEPNFETNARRIAEAKGYEPVFINARNPGQAADEARGVLASRGNPQYGTLGFSLGASSANSLMSDPDMRNKNLETITIGAYGPTDKAGGFGNLSNLQNWNNYPDKSSKGMAPTGSGHLLEGAHEEGPGTVASELEGTGQSGGPPRTQEIPTIDKSIPVKDRNYNGYQPADKHYQTAEQAGIKPEFPVADNVNWQLMDAEMVARLNQRYRALPEEQKQQVKMISGYRPTEREEADALGMDRSSSQRDIWERYTRTGEYKNADPSTYHSPQKAGKPGGGAPHTWGGAGDFEGAEYMLQGGDKYGLHGESNDPPHINMTRGNGMHAADVERHAPIDKPVEQIKAKPVEHIRAPFSAGAQAKKEDVEDHPINKFAVKNHSDQDISWQSQAAGAL